MARFLRGVGINALFVPNIEARMREIIQRPANDTGNRFRLHGEDEGCEVEGTWHDWICFAHNILASENTRIAYPELYRPELANDNS